MSKSVLNSLWDKICDVFVTRTYAAAIGTSKQDPLIAGRGIRIKDNVISNKLIPNDEEDFEEVVVSILSDTANVANKTLNVYYNGSLLPNETYTTNENGTCTFEVPYGYAYEIDFPIVSGYLLITPEKHVAMLMQRLIEVEYIPLPSIDDDDYGEEVTIHLDKFENNQVTPFEGINVSVKVGTANAVTYTTDENGNTISFKVRYGLSYTVTVPTMTDYYMSSTKYTKTYTSEKRNRIINFSYKYLRVGVFIVDKYGNEYTGEEWELARDVNLTINNEDAILLKIATSTLARYNGIFYIDIDNLRLRNYNTTGIQWCSSATLFNFIPQSHINYMSSSTYYYNGYAESVLTLIEGDYRGLSTPAVDKCLALSRTFIDLNGEIIETLKGFLGGAGLWLLAWNNRTTIDELLDITRPAAEKPEEATYYTFSALTSAKWTSAQESGGTRGYQFSTSILVAGSKSNNCQVIPFFCI